MRWFSLGTDLFLAGFAVWQLLIAYRVVGKPPGADEKYEAWHRQWAFILKLIGWGGVVVIAAKLVVDLLW
jgi:hypothetical protein